MANLRCVGVALAFCSRHWQHAQRGVPLMLDYFLNALVTLLVTVDPIGLAPVFVVLTTGMAGSARRQTAYHASAVAAGVLIAFALIGEPLIGFLGISLPAFKISGGLLLFAIAFEMIFGLRMARKTNTAQDVASREESNHVAVFPLAIPMISGPGAISATILLATRAPSPWATVMLLVIILLMIGVCLAIFLVANRAERLLGETGRIVVSRLLGLLLAALSVQFVADGIVAIANGNGTP
jgi:multiple antibiotic resistance protein